VRAIVARFHETYEREYTYRLDAPVEFVGVHVVASAEVGKLTPAPLPVTGATAADARKGEREVDFAPEGVAAAAIYDGAALEPGMAFDGPAIVESAGTTVVVRPGDRAEMDDYGNLHIDVGVTA
jgi:N-methylhydantoinase A